MERPLLIPLTGLMAGLFIAGLTSFSLPAAAVYAAGAVTLTAFLHPRLPFLAALWIFMLCWGNHMLRPLIAPSLPPDHIARAVSAEPVIVEGVIDARPEPTDTGGRFFLRTEKLVTVQGERPVSGRLIVSVREGTVPFLTGDRVRFETRLREPRNFGIPGEFDYRRYLAFRRVFVTAGVPSADRVILMRAGVDYRLQRFVDGTAARLCLFIGTHLPPVEGGVLRALLLGERGMVGHDLEDAYSRAGVNHILSISGFHVGVIALVCFQLLLFAGSRSEALMLRFNLRRFILLLTLPPLVGYFFLTGAAPATFRSVVMIAAFVAALLVEREQDPLNSLMLAAFIILVVSPAALFDISFQLSFLAIWGIIVLTPLFMTPFRRLQGRLVHKLLLFLSVSLAATLATLLPVAYHFHRVSLTGLLSNFIVVPLLGYGAVLLGFAALPFIPLAPPVAVVLLRVAALLVSVADAAILRLAKIPLLPPLPATRLHILLTLLFLAVVSFIRPGRLRIAAAAVTALLCVATLLMHGDPDRGKLVVTFFSVGQGESSLVSFPDGRQMLIDGGGSLREGGSDPGERLVAPALRTLGVTRLDWLVLTHPHPDHMGGLRYIAREFPIGEFWHGPVESFGDEYRALRDTLLQRGVTVRTVAAGVGSFNAGGVRIVPLAPAAGGAPPAGEPGGEELNDTSLVLKLDAGRFSVLFTGDAGFPEEEALLRKPDLLRCSILKVGHHGSRYASSDRFLSAVFPEVGVVSAGYGNSFGLPSPVTLSRLKRHGVKLYRTDLDGTVQAVCDIRTGQYLMRTLPGSFN
jgi:competence protein ComEC